jgi:hypothetical protein
MPMVARESLARAGVDERVEVIVGAALDTLPTLADREEPFDLIFIDADKENNVAYVEWAIKLGAPGAQPSWWTTSRASGACSTQPRTICRPAPCATCWR